MLWRETRAPSEAGIAGAMRVLAALAALARVVGRMVVIASRTLTVAVGTLAFWRLVTMDQALYLPPHGIFTQMDFHFTLQ